MNIKIRLRLKLFLWLLLAACCHANAQQFRASLLHFSTEDGLASNAISNITQDDYGYIWIATWNGLSRFDGYNFYNYRTGNGSHIPNLHNRIVAISIDNAQNVWMRMYDGRVFVVDRRIDCIIDPLEGINGHEEFRTTHPLITTSSGDVMAFYDGVGLYRMHFDRNGLKTQLFTTSKYVITSMAEGYQNDIWVGTDQGVHRLDMSNLSVERKGYFTDEYINCIYSNGYNVFAGTKSGKIVTFSYGQEPKVIKEGSSPVTSLLVDSQGLIWYCDNRNGASRFDPKTGDDKLFTQNVPVQEYDGYGGVFHEAIGTVWTRMNHGGYGYYNRQTDELEYFHNDPSNPWNLSNTVNASKELEEGVVWMSTSRRGLEKLEILKNTISRKMLVPDGTPLQNEIRAMYYDNKRNLLLIGNKDNQLFVFRQDGTHTIISQDSNGNPIGRVYGITMDSKGNYWMCSKDHGLFKITPNGGSFHIQNYCHDDNNKWSLSSNNAYAAVEDKKGNIWVATYGGGVNVLTTNKEGKQVFLHSGNGLKNYPASSFNKIRTVALGSDGMVWAGSTDGILLMSAEKGQASVVKLQNSTEDPDHILMSNDIVYLIPDKKGNMWVGTNGGGLSHTIGQDSEGTWLFESYGSADGLPSEEIKSITFTSQGNVWFATDHILCSFDVEKKIFSTFSNLDGVDETLCSEGAAITLPNGDILFGTLKGYYSVDRKKLETSTGSMLKLHITDFYMNDELQSPRFNKTFDIYIPDAKEVRLPTHNTVFSFRFASLNYQLQHRVHYQYMLEGHDKDWKNADKSRMASYSNVPAGTYRFKVKAFLLESPEKYDLRTIEIKVPPYFLLSSGAIWVYMLLASGCAIWFMFRRQKEIAKKHAEQTNDGTDGASDSSSTNEEASFADKQPEEQAPEEPELAEEVTDDYIIIE